MPFDQGVTEQGEKPATTEGCAATLSDEDWSIRLEEMSDLAANLAAEVIDELMGDDTRLLVRLQDEGHLTGLTKAWQGELHDKLVDAISRHRPVGV